MPPGIKNEKAPLLSQKEPAPTSYGIFHKKGKDGKSNLDDGKKPGAGAVKKVPLRAMFRHADKVDAILLTFGTIAAVIHGAGFPALALVFGNMTKTFIVAAQKGFSSSGTNSSNFNFSSSTTTSPTSFQNATQSILGTTLAVRNGTEEFSNISSTAISTMGSTISRIISSTVAPGTVPGMPLTPEEFSSLMTWFSLVYVGIGFAVFFASVFQIAFWVVSCERQMHKLRQEFFYQVMRMEIAWFDFKQSGALTMKLNDDLERVREGMGDKFSMCIENFSAFASGLVVGFYTSWRLSLVILACTPLLAGTTAYFGRIVVNSTMREQQKYGNAGSVAEEVLSCIRTVTAFGGQDKAINTYNEHLEAGRLTSQRKYTFMAFAFLFIMFVIYGSYALAFWYGAELVLWEYMNAGDVFTVFFSVMLGSTQLGNALPFITVVATSRGAASSIHEVLDSKPKIDAYSREGLQPKNPQGQVSFENITFNYPSRPDITVLRNVSFTLDTGKTVAVVGSSGCGKSTLVNLLLRFYDPTSGMVKLDGTDIKQLNLAWLRSQIGVVSQEPILFDCSIAENIEFGSDDVTFSEIVRSAEAANVHNFIMGLPQGYSTNVGERGAQISGGQKQRIAIARALVKDPKILILDEATSALDSESEGIVQEALDKAREGRTTLVIAHRLSTIRNADKIIAMENGVLKEVGTHDELMAKNGVYFNLVTTQTFIDEDGGAHDLTSGTDSTAFTDGSVTYGQGRAKKYAHRRSKEDELASSFDWKRLENDISEENFQPAGVLKVLKYCGPDMKWIFLGSFGCALSGLVMPIYAFLYAEIFNTFTLTGEELRQAASFWSLMFVALAVFGGVGAMIRTAGMGFAGDRLTTRMRLMCFKNILRQPISWFDDERHSTGKLSTRLATDSPMVKAAAGHRLGIVLAAIVTIIGALSLAFVFGWKLALAVSIASPILVIAGYIQVRVQKVAQKKDVELMESAGNIATQAIQNIRTVQALNRERTFFENYVMNLQEPFQEAKKQAYVYGLVYAFSQGVIFLIYAGAFRFGAYLVSIEDMTPTEVYRVFFAIAFCAVSVGQMNSYVSEYTKAKLSAGLLIGLITREPEIDSYAQGGLRKPVSGKVAFRDIHFSYPQRAKVPVLQGMSFTLRPGETMALVGQSGSGKSTVVSLIQRFYDPHRGQILIDDVDLRAYNVQFIRRQVSVVSQEPVLFDCSIKENITYGLENPEFVPMEAIIAAAQSANIHDFIVSLADGYNTRVGDKGTQLSGGQKQRIAIARALIRDPKILLLDEATSALDTESEKVVQEAIEKARVGRTCIIVAHRLSTIQNADCIGVVDRGKIVEYGTHEELRAKKGLYYKLTKRQQISAHH